MTSLWTEKLKTREGNLEERDAQSLERKSTTKENAWKSVLWSTKMGGSLRQQMVPRVMLTSPVQSAPR